MEQKTLRQIKRFSTDKRNGNALVALMDWYGVVRLQDVTEEMGQEFLEKLRNGEVRV